MNKKKEHIIIVACLCSIVTFISLCRITYFSTPHKSFQMVYEVRQGEKLSDIARKFNVKEKDIEAINNCGEYISQGRKIIIPR